MTMRAQILTALFVTVVTGHATAQMAFDVASVRPNKTGDAPYSNFPLGPGDVYGASGGFFKATGLPLITYLGFAYKITGEQRKYLLPQLPSWATTDRFDIEARAPGNPTKDQMRLMMRALLADRFKLAVHNETREIPVFALVPVRPGKSGPELRPHPDQSSCPPVADGIQCGGLFVLPPREPGRQRVGARNVSLELIARTLTDMGNLGRPVLDRTGLTGTFDFSLEWTPDSGVNPAPDTSGPPFQEALKEQCGLKLESQKGPFELMIVDRLEQPSEN